MLFIIYKAEYFHQGTKANYYKIYYIIGIVFLFFSIINFFLNKELKIKTSLIVLSTIFSFYLFEGFLLISGISKEEFINRLDDPGIQAKLKKNPNFDTRSLIEVYKDMKIKDFNKMPQDLFNMDFQENKEGEIPETQEELDLHMSLN